MSTTVLDLTCVNCGAPIEVGTKDKHTESWLEKVTAPLLFSILTKRLVYKRI